MSSFHCPTCLVIWTTKNSPLVDIHKTPKRTCNDCATFDWPKFTKAQEYVKSLGLTK